MLASAICMPASTSTGPSSGGWAAAGGVIVIRLLIVEDHPICADGLALLLRDQADIALIGIARDERTADELITGLRPDVILCDVMLGGNDGGLRLLARYCRRSRFVLFSLFDYPSHHVRAVRGGAAGFVPHAADLDGIAGTIRRAAAGVVVFPPDVLANVRSAPREPTERERELLVMLARGATNEELATRMDLRIKSVEGMLRRLFDRYGVENRTQLAWFATRQGWLTGAPATPPRPRPIAVGGRA
jgi:DNA-binding NarL/FixJ family response regulator